jgi:hypothetical protein
MQLGGPTARVWSPSPLLAVASTTGVNSSASFILAKANWATSLLSLPRIRSPFHQTAESSFSCRGVCRNKNRSVPSARQNHAAGIALFGSLPFSSYLSFWAGCRRDLTVGARDTRMRLGTVFGSLPPRDRHTGCRPWSLGFLFAQTVTEVRVKKEGAARTSDEEVDSTCFNCLPRRDTQVMEWPVAADHSHVIYYTE